MTRPSLNDLNAFVAVATHRSFRKAADMIGVSRSALSHAIRGLERQLGTSLLHRTTRSVALTEAGERLLARLVPVLEDLDVVLGETGAAQGQPSGSLRINGSDAAIRLLVETVVPRFLRRYPGMALDLAVDGTLVDIVGQGFDAGLRLGEAVPKDMVAVCLVPALRFLAVASPAYLAEASVPAVPEDLHAHRCIRHRFPSGKRYRWEFAKQGREVVIDVPGALTLNDAGLMVHAAAQGLGIAYVSEAYARPALDDGRLVTVLEDWRTETTGLYLYFPSNRHMSAGLRALVDMVKEAR